MIALVSRAFVPVALDVWFEQRRRDGVGEWYRALVAQRTFAIEGGNTQGLYVATAGGRLIDAWNHRDPSRTRARLERGLERFVAEFAPLAPVTSDAQAIPDPPEGARVVDVFARVLDGDWDQALTEEDPILRRALARDRLWILRDEERALASGVIPQKLLRRIALFHLVDGTRGEAPHWRPRDVRALAATIACRAGVLELEGRVRLGTHDGARAFDAVLHGIVDGDGERITRFELVVRGAFRGEGRYTPGAPRGSFTLGLAFVLAESPAPVDVPPAAAHDVAGYLDAR